MGPLARPIAIVGAGVVSAQGLGHAGLSRMARVGNAAPRPSAELARSHPGTPSFELGALPEPSSVAERRARGHMSRSAALASVATQAALESAGWNGEREDVGFYLGVGASGGAVEQLDAMLGASITDHEFSLERFGDAGLRACNPLFAFQLMQNFTLCHSAIVHGIAGPNAAYYSRGAGTVTALYEAAHAVLEGECSRALAGGADSAVHAVTFAELVRDGFVARGLVPGEGAAVFSLGDVAGNGAALAFVEHVSVLTGGESGLHGALSEGRWAGDFADVDAVILAPWGRPARDTLSAFVLSRLPGRSVVDASLLFGEALAAGPALAWGLGVDLLREESLRRVLILSAGLDGDVGVVVLRSGTAP